MVIRCCCAICMKASDFLAKGKNKHSTCLLFVVQSTILLLVALEEYCKGGLSSRMAPNASGDRGEKRAPLEIFCSYAHEDEWLRQEFERHLSLLSRQGIAALRTYSLIL